MERYADEVKKMMRQYRKVKSWTISRRRALQGHRVWFSQIIEAFRGATDFPTQLRCTALKKK